MQLSFPMMPDCWRQQGDRVTKHLQKCDIQMKPTFPEDLAYDSWCKWAEVGEQIQTDQQKYVDQVE